MILRAALPDAGENPAAKALFTDAWRGLWRLVNLLQEAQGFHVEIDGLDTLAPPDMSGAADDATEILSAWEEARALCDDAYHPLIDALVAAETPAPDKLGDDLLVDGRVVGMIEFGWTAAEVAIAETDVEGVGWTLIVFDPDTDTVGPTVTKLIKALQGVNQ